MSREGCGGRVTRAKEVEAGSATLLAWMDDVPSYLNAKLVVCLASVEHIHDVP